MFSNVINSESGQNQKQFDCTFCDKTFQTDSSLAVHRKIHLTNSANPYFCCICHARFSCETDYTAHFNSKCMTFQQENNKQNKPLTEWQWQ